MLIDPDFSERSKQMLQGSGAFVSEPLAVRLTLTRAAASRRHELLARVRVLEALK